MENEREREKERERRLCSAFGYENRRCRVLLNFSPRAKRRRPFTTPRTTSAAKRREKSRGRLYSCRGILFRHFLDFFSLSLSLSLSLPVATLCSRDSTPLDGRSLLPCSCCRVGWEEGGGGNGGVRRSSCFEYRIYQAFSLRVPRVKKRSPAPFRGRTYSSLVALESSSLLLCGSTC